MTFPPENPSPGIWVVTQRVWDSWVLPVRNSPNTSVMAMDSRPPPSSLLSSMEPVPTRKTFLLFKECCRAVRKPALVPQIFSTASFILSTLASDKPLMAQSLFLVTIWIPLTVQIPAVFSFLMSATLMPWLWSNSMSWKKSSSSSWRAWDWRSPWAVKLILDF